jgi:carbonic anhydrase
MPLTLLKGIRHFKNHQLKEKCEEMAALGQGQSPDVIFITCSDSRISPHLFTHSGLGMLFLGRNPGNIVEPIDPSDPSSRVSGEAATIEFGVTALKVSEIIICGHSHCGAMKGLLTPDLDKTLPNTAEWLKHSSYLVEHLEKRHPELTDDLLKLKGLTEDNILVQKEQLKKQKLKCLTQDNILLQMEHLKTHPVVIKGLKEGTVKIHGWYYEIETGEVYVYNQQKNTFVSFEDTVKELVLERLNNIIIEETAHYFSELLNPKSSEELLDLMSMYNKVRFTGVSPIWSHIEKTVREKLQQQVGELYITEDGGISPLFDEVLKKGPSTRLQNLDFVSKAIEQSPFYASLRAPIPMQHWFHRSPAQKVPQEEPSVLASTI